MRNICSSKTWLVAFHALTAGGQIYLVQRGSRDIDPHDCALLTAPSKWHVHATQGILCFSETLFVGLCALQHENLAHAGFHQSTGSKVTIARWPGGNFQTQTCKSYILHSTHDVDRNYDSEQRR